MTGIRVLFVGISAATGTCFAVLAGLSISAAAFPARRFHFFSVVVAAVAIYLAVVAFRTAIAGKIDEENLVTSLRRGMIGAFVGLIVMIFFLLMFRADTLAFLAHSLGKPASSFSDFRLMSGAVLLGFGTGFVVRAPKAAA
ncbi:MAG: hypothetical protein ACE14M_13810 [Terriglobales bacterium]